MQRCICTQGVSSKSGGAAGGHAVRQHQPAEWGTCPPAEWVKRPTIGREWAGSRNTAGYNCNDRPSTHKPAPSRRKDRQPDPAAPAGCGSKVEHASIMLPKHQQHRKHREQIGRKPADEPGLDLEHARIASSKASHALTSSIGKGMAGNVATFYSSTKAADFLQGAGP